MASVLRRKHRHGPALTVVQPDKPKLSWQRWGDGLVSIDALRDAELADEPELFDGDMLAPTMDEIRPKLRGGRADRDYPPHIRLLDLLPNTGPHIHAIAMMYASRRGRRWLSPFQKQQFRRCRDRALRQQPSELAEAA